MDRYSKLACYSQILERLERLLQDETDEIAIMATVACELHHGLEHFHWTGFYRVTQPETLTIGPYQGMHGCLTIPFSRGVCGAAARTRETQVVEDVTRVPYHIACSATTRSEIVVPMVDSGGAVRAVLDVDSDEVAAFDTVDREWLERIAALISRRIGW